VVRGVCRGDGRVLLCLVSFARCAMDREILVRVGSFVPVGVPRYEYGRRLKSDAETKKPRWGKPGFRKRTNEGVGEHPN
jgi:hypothetical protein